MKKSLIFLTLLYCSTAGAGVPDPEYDIYFKDGVQAKYFFSNNESFKEFQNSNLYQGLMIRLAPVLFALSEKESAPWSGRLADYLAEKLLSGQQAWIAYYKKQGLVSPFGVAIVNPSGTTKAAAKALLKFFQSTDPQQVEIESGKFVTVTPVAMKLQKFGVILGEKCLIIGRDPKVVSYMSLQCEKLQQPSADATLNVHLDEMMPSISAVLQKWLQIKTVLRAEMSFDSKTSAFHLKSAAVDLKSPSPLLAGKVDTELLASMPSETLFFSTAFLPDPESWEPDAIAGYIQRVQKKQINSKKASPVTLVYLGTEKDGLTPKSQTALILKPASAGADTLSHIQQLFGHTGLYDVQIRKICGGYVAVAPLESTLNILEDSCQKKRPQFLQRTEKVVAFFSAAEASVVSFVNLAAISSNFLDLGWKSKGNETEPPSEFNEARKTLNRLPVIAFRGKAVDRTIRFEAVEE